MDFFRRRSHDQNFQKFSVASLTRKAPNRRSPPRSHMSKQPRERADPFGRKGSISNTIAEGGVSIFILFVWICFFLSELHPFVHLLSKWLSSPTLCACWLFAHEIPRTIHTYSPHRDNVQRAPRSLTTRCARRRPVAVSPASRWPSRRGRSRPPRRRTHTAPPLRGTTTSLASACRRRHRIRTRISRTMAAAAAVWAPPRRPLSRRRCSTRRAHSPPRRISAATRCLPARDPAARTLAATACMAAPAVGTAAADTTRVSTRRRNRSATCRSRPRRPVPPNTVAAVSLASAAALAPRTGPRRPPRIVARPSPRPPRLPLPPRPPTSHPPSPARRSPARSPARWGARVRAAAAAAPAVFSRAAAAAAAVVAWPRAP